MNSGLLILLLLPLCWADWSAFGGDAGEATLASTFAHPAAQEDVDHHVELIHSRCRTCRMDIVENDHHHCTTECAPLPPPPPVGPNIPPISPSHPPKPPSSPPLPSMPPPPSPDNPPPSPPPVPPSPSPPPSPPPPRIPLEQEPILVVQHGAVEETDGALLSLLHTAPSQATRDDAAGAWAPPAALPPPSASPKKPPPTLLKYAFNTVQRLAILYPLGFWGVLAGAGFSFVWLSHAWLRSLHSSARGSPEHQRLATHELPMPPGWIPDHGLQLEVVAQAGSCPPQMDGGMERSWQAGRMVHDMAMEKALSRAGISGELD